MVPGFTKEAVISTPDVTSGRRNLYRPGIRFLLLVPMSIGTEGRNDVTLSANPEHLQI
jgi:hypothetical protein